MKFTYPVYVPSIDKHINFREFLNKHYITLVKFLSNEDDENTQNYFHRLIDHLNDDITWKTLNKIDKFCIILSLRITSIGPELVLDLTCSKTDQKYTGKIDLYAILSMVSQMHMTKNRICNMANGVKAHLGMPSSLFYGDSREILDVIADVIQCIEIKGVKHNTSALSIREKNELIDKLPGNNFSKLLNYVSSTQKKLNDMLVFKDKSPHDEDAEVTEYKLGLYDNSMFDFLKLCYRTHIANYYNNMYTLCDTMGFTADYIENITPAESSIYIAQKKQEIEQQKQQADRQQAPTIGSPMSYGNLP